MEKNIKKNVYICVTESPCCTAEINTTLQINYTTIKEKTKTGFFFQGDHGVDARCFSGCIQTHAGFLSIPSEELCLPPVEEPVLPEGSDSRLSELFTFLNFLPLLFPCQIILPI